MCSNSCSVLQCVAREYIEEGPRVESSGQLQCIAVCCSVLQCVAVCCSVLQCAAREHIEEGPAVESNG